MMKQVQATCTMPWVLSWFSHSLENINDILRIWDYLLCSNQSAILYVCAAFIIIHHNGVEEGLEDDMVEC